jgi:hypothetical protein
MYNNRKCIRDRETTVYMAKVIKFPQLSIPCDFLERWIRIFGE